MRFKSPIVAFTVFCRHKVEEVRDPGTGALTREGLPALIANFAVHRGEFQYTNPDTGMIDTAADIAGHFFDSEIAQEIEGWTDSERELVEQKLLKQCDITPEWIQPWEDPKVAAPWPSYDEAEPKRIPALAIEFGNVGHALSYERQNQAREDVLAALEKANGGRQEQPEPEPEPEPSPDEDALVAAVS